MTSQACAPDAKLVAILSCSSGQATASYVTLAALLACHFANASSENFAAPGGAGSGGSGVSTLSITSPAHAGRRPLVHKAGSAPAIAAPAAPRFKKSRRAGWRLSSLLLHDDIAASPPRSLVRSLSIFVYTQ